MSALSVVYINLDRSAERQRVMHEHLQGLGISAQRWPGTDGRALSREQLSTYSAIDALVVQGRPMSLGEIGCFLSHLSVWQHMQAQSLDHCLVLEDDMTISQRLVPVCDSIIRSGLAFDYINFFSSQGVRAVTDQVIEGDCKLARFLTPPNGACCYLISLPGATKLLSQSLPVRAALDGFMAEYSADVIRYGVSCDLAAHEGRLPSTIRNGSIAGKLKRRAVMLKYLIARPLCRRGHGHLATRLGLIDPPDRVPF